MQLIRIISFLSLIILFQLPTKVLAVKRELSPAAWQQLTSDKDFNYKDQKEQEIKKQSDNSSLANALNNFLEFFSNGIGQFLFWLAVLIILGYAAYKIFFNERFSLFKKEKKKAAETTVIEQDIAFTNWEQHLQNALQKNDLRLAVRYSYMWLLQLLQNKELIEYRSDKTNYEYYSELIDTPFKQPFKQLSREYEYAWYGHFALSEAAYNSYMQLFNNIKKQLS